MRTGKIAAFVLTAVLGLAAVVGLSVPVAAQEGCNATTWNLTAGQFTDVGSVTVSSDATNIYVNYTLDYQNAECADGAVEAEFGTLHVWIGNDLLLVPATPGNKQCPAGVPQPGQFCQTATGQCFNATGLTTYTFVFPIADLELAGYNFCGSNLYVLTHAEVNYKNCDGTLSGAGDTAWGGDAAGNCNRWYFYGSFTPACETCGVSSTPECETSYAKGGWVWTTDRKSNPENLPSLKLTRNRWGWPINLAAPGTYQYVIWEGAGLNKTCELGNAGSVDVGTLTLDWDGVNVVVNYTMDTPYACGADPGTERTLAEVHVYAGDLSPTTIAPGQYGFIDSFDPGASSYTVTLPLADANGTGGVWVVAHAVTCTQ